MAQAQQSAQQAQVTIEIMGGLGNQLFQVCTSLAYGLRTQRQVYFTAEPIRIGARKVTYWHNLLKPLQPLLRPATATATAAITAYHEPHFHYKEIPPHQTHLHGYFQSYKYIEPYATEILQKLELFQSYRINSIALHFRVGDYAKNPQCHPLLPLSYYERALQHIILAKTPLTNVLYFYEAADEAYVADKITTLKSKFAAFTFTPVKHHLADWQQFTLMAKCSAFVIANSTFSWWAAYVAHIAQQHNIAQQQHNSPPIVCYPNLWFGPGLGPSMNTADLCPPSWHKVI